MKKTIVNMSEEDEEFLNEFFDSTHEKSAFKTEAMSLVVKALRNSKQSVVIEIDLIAKRALRPRRD